MVHFRRWLKGALIAFLLMPAVTIATTRTVEAGPASQQATAEDESVLPGRVFLDAKLKAMPNSAEQVEEVRGIIAVDPETGRWEKIVDDGFLVRVSPDGKVLAFVKVNPAKSNSPRIAESGEIWTYDLSSHAATRILDYGGWLCWSLDGRQIVSTKTHRTDESTYEKKTWQVNRDGSGRTKLPVPETDIVGDWSGDGKWFVTVANRSPSGRGLQLYRMHPDGSEESRLTPDGHNCYPRFSPDSRQIVYFHRGRETGNSLHVMDADGTNDHEVLREEGLTGVEGSCFSPDGRRLAVVRSNQQLANGKKVYRETEGSFHLEVVNADGKNRRELRLDRAKVLWLGHPDWR
jgi:Tol biopolymer transport system component